MSKFTPEIVDQFTGYPEAGPTARWQLHFYKNGQYMAREPVGTKYNTAEQIMEKARLMCLSSGCEKCIIQKF
jgi:hypothetical protein